MIEVEQRSFITKDVYEKLLSKIENCKTIKQVSLYYDTTIDYRIMLTNEYTRMWLKKGKMHDDAREELIVEMNNDFRDNLLKIQEALGYKIDIKWFRERNEGTYKGIDITLDYTIGYGYILELEKVISDENDIDETKKHLLELFNELGIVVSSKEEFNDKFVDYKINWKKYTDNITIEEFLK